MNTTPYTVYPETPVPQVFNLFRSMGLRHLPVVDHFGQVRITNLFHMTFIREMTIVCVAVKKIIQLLILPNSNVFIFSVHQT